MNFNIKLKVDKVMQVLAEKKPLRILIYSILATIFAISLINNLAEILLGIAELIKVIK